MPAQKLVDIQDFQAVTAPNVVSTTAIAVIGGSGATAGAKQIPAGATIPGTNTPTLVTSLRQGRDLFGWLPEPTGAKYSGTHVVLTESSGTGVNKISRNSIPRALESIFANAEVPVVVVRFTDTATGDARQTNILNALNALRDNNQTGVDPSIIVIPEESWAGASPSAVAVSAIGNLESMCQTLDAFGIIAMPPFTAADAVGTTGMNWVTNTNNSDTRLLRVYPHISPTWKSVGRWDPSPALAGAFARSDVTAGIANNPRGIIIQGARQTSPRISHSPILATSQSAILRGANVAPIIIRNGIKLFGTVMSVADGSNRADRFVNVFRTKIDIQRNLQIIAEQATELNANPARTYLLAQGSSLLRRYEALGAILSPTFQLDPVLDVSGETDVYAIASYLSVNPTERITIRVGPRGLV